MDNEQVTHGEIKAEIRQLQDIVKKLERNQEELLTQFNRYKGFFGGIVFVISAIWASLALLTDWVKQNGS